MGDARRPPDPGPRGFGARELGAGAVVGGDAGRSGELLGAAGAMGDVADDTGDRVLVHCVRGAPAEHGEGPGEEEVPRRGVRPARFLERLEKSRGVQAQGDQERSAGIVGAHRVLRAAVGVLGDQPAGEFGNTFGGSMAQEHRGCSYPVQLK
ncbi:unnamed protein product [Linum tenue]|uniref:Uncharacterized protein n=1 Tax=Linum tenue TaxID=586396 RepID=A0AAV0Q740_9ROSI|nr:unnamed protein product [Linum tenue]